MKLHTADGGDKMLRDDTPSALLFFIQQSGIGNASPLLKDAGSRIATQGGDAGPPRLKTFHSVWITGSMNEVKKKGGKGEEEQGNGEEEREKERKKVAYTHTHVHTEQCTLRDLGNGKWERGEEIMISKRYRVPYVPKDYPLNLGLISGKKKKKKKRDDTNYRDDRWRMINSWATPVPEHVGGQLNERNSLRENCNAYFRDKTHWTRNGSFVLSWRWIWNLGKETFLAME